MYNPDEDLELQASLVIDAIYEHLNEISEQYFQQNSEDSEMNYHCGSFMRYNDANVDVVKPKARRRVPLMGVCAIRRRCASAIFENLSDDIHQSQDIVESSERDRPPRVDNFTRFDRCIDNFNTAVEKFKCRAVYFVGMKIKRAVNRLYLRILTPR